MKVGIVGSGYVGLVTGACLAELGHEVVCADLDGARVADINGGKSPIHEAGLEDLIRRNIGARLNATTDVHEAAGDAHLVFLAVGTPLSEGVMDDRALLAATEQVGEAWRGRRNYPVLVVKSTVVPGTTERLVGPTLMRAAGATVGEQVGLGANPEFLTEGRAVEDFMQPDRIVIGANDDKSVDVIRSLYRVFPDSRMLVTNTSTAEMIKYASNSLLATLISFSNEIANIGTAVGGIDVAQVMEGVHASRYLSVVTAEGDRSLAPITSFLWAGCGYGGSCLPKDTQALAALARQAGETPRVLEAVSEVNNRQPERMISILEEELPSLAGAQIAVLGLAFKPETDDTRESPAIPIITRLLDAGAKVTAHDPVVKDSGVMDLVRAGLSMADSLEEAISDAEAIVVVTRWNQYLELPLLISSLGTDPLLVDGRRMFDPRVFPRYRGIGL